MIICLLFLLLIVLPMRLSLHYSAVTARRYAHNYRQRVFTAMIRAPFSVSPKSLQSSSSSSSSNSAVGINRPTVPVTVGQQLELTIHDLTNQGFGVARYENWVVMVPLTLPGEIVQARIVHNYSSYSEAEIVNILQASADRVTPLCKFYEQCGGCHYQHMTIDSQRRWKQKQVQTALTRIGLIDVSASKGISVGEVIGTEEYYNYRAKLTPHVSKEKGITSIGFYGRKGKDIIDVDQCAIATTAINRKYTELREQLSKNKDNRSIKTKKTTKNKQKEDTLSIREANGAVSSDETKIMTQTVKDFQYEFRAGDFFQNNPFLLPLMVDYVLAEASEIFRTNISNAAEIAATVGDNNKLLVDAYCGSGLFAISASKLFKKVIGIEVSEKAVASAKRNAEINNVENCEFISGEAQEIFKCITKIENSHEGMDLDSHYNADNTVVIIDPPRRGCDEVFIRQLLEYNPKIIVYVSCDPVTQARDARDFINAGYVIKKITPFDLFPQTRHLENVITFSR